MDAKKPSLKGAWLGHVNHLNFGGHQPYLWNGWSSQVLSTEVYGQCGKLVTVVGHKFITLTVDGCVYRTVSARHCVARVCQRQRRFVLTYLCSPETLGPNILAIWVGYVVSDKVRAYAYYMLSYVKNTDVW